MAANLLSADGLPSNLSGMSKTQLYDIMSQLKTLIDQNPDQAKEILSQNPLLTRALFQAQIMLGMVQAPAAVPNIQPSAALHNPKPSNTQLTQIGQTSGSQPPTPLRKQPSLSLDGQSQTQSLPTNPLQLSQQSKAPLLAVSQPPSITQPARSTASTQLQQPLPTSGGSMYVPSQPPLPIQPRPPSVLAFPHPQMGTNASFQHPTAPQFHHSQPIFQSGVKPLASVGPSFSQGQPSIASQAPLQSPYMGGGERVSSGGGGWMPETSSPINFSGQPSSSTYIPGLAGPTNLPAQSSSLTPDLEKAVLQQLMSLGPEQVNLLPPDQRNQILQLQRILRNQQ